MVQMVGDEDKCYKIPSFTREKPPKATKFNFTCCEQSLKVVDHYKYLGVFFHEHLSPSHTVDALTSAASRSFGRVVGIFKQLKILRWKMYETLYNAYVTPIMN